MDHLGATGEAEDGFDFAAVAASQPGCVSCVVSDQAASDLFAVRAENRDRIAALEAAINLAHPRREQAFATAERLNRAGVDGEDPTRFEPAGDPLLARSHRAGFGQEPRAAGAVSDAAERVQLAA